MATATKNRFKISIAFIFIGFSALIYPKFAREVITYWYEHKKYLNNKNIDELHK